MYLQHRGVIFIEKFIEPLKNDKISNHNFIFCVLLFNVVNWGRVGEICCPYVVLICQLIVLW